MTSSGEIVQGMGFKKMYVSILDRHPLHYEQAPTKDAKTTNLFVNGCDDHGVGHP